MSVVLSGAANPEVSVLMVTHGSWPLTERALRALVANTRAPFELVVVDNASNDETRARLAELEHARVILNDANRGFGPATNQAAAHARAEHLLLLNTDAFVHPGWLEPMLETIRRPEVRAVVPRYLHEDGSLQEAGALLARDGTVVVYGDGSDPDAFSYRFRRVVDFGGAACMLIGANTFRSLHGFDERYAPAYYEDADLCLRIAQSGYSVMYEPRAVVTHVRFGSGSAQGAIQSSERNREPFAARWGAHLTGRPWSLRDPSQQAVIAARDGLASPRFLVSGSPIGWEVRSLVSALRVGWPESLITWATGPLADSFDPHPWLDLGVELVASQGSAWLGQRLLHYDLAVLSGRCDAELVAALERTQPQASRVWLHGIEREPQSLTAQMSPYLIEAGIAPAKPPSRS
jgi:GT2 family glycosyltransferase